MAAKGAGGAGVVKGRPARTVAGQSVMRKLAKAAPKPAVPPNPTRSPGSRIQAPKIGGVSRARLSGLKMNEGAGRRGAARQQRRESMAMQRQMLGSAREKTAAIQRQVFGRVKPGRSAEPLATGGTLAARASLGRARAKAGPGASPAQRGAVKRAGTYLKASRERNRTAVKGAMPKGTMAKPKGQKPGPVNATQSTRLPAAQRPGSLTNTLGKTLRNLARADAARIREIEAITGQKIRRTPASAGAGKEAGARVRAVAKGGKVSATLRAGLRELAQSDARTVRGMASIVRDATPKVGGAKGGKAIGGGKPAQAGGNAKAAAVKSLKFSKSTSSRQTAELSNGGRVNIAQNGPRSFRASLVSPSGSPRMERRNFKNVSQAKAWAKTPNARGPRLMGGKLNTETTAKATWFRGAKPARVIKGKPALAGGKAKAAASKPATARPTINRTRKQAAAVQLDRKRQTLENTKAIRGRQSYIAPEGIIRKSTKVNQRNILTGGIDRVTTKVQTKVQEERVSPLSSFGRKNAARSERASNRLDALIQAKRNTPKPRKATERAALAKIQKSISTVGRSFDSYRNARSGRRTKKP